MVYCDYANCKTKKSYGVPRFVLPNDNRREKWLLNTGNSYSFKLISSEAIYICADHFDKKFINYSSMRSRLSMDAIPNLYISDHSKLNFENKTNFGIHTGNEENQINVSKRLRNESVQNHSDANQRKVLSVIAPANGMVCARTSTPIASTSRINDEYVRRVTSPSLKTYSNVFSHFEGSEHTEISEEQFPFPDHFSEYEKKINFDDYVCEVKIPIDELLQSPKKKLFKPEKHQHLLYLNYIEKKLEEKPKSIATFVKSQIFHTKNSKWSSGEKELFLKFHYKSPSFYKYLQREGFALPSLRTINRWYNLISFDTGISYAILSMLKHKLNELPDLNKKCILVFDKMSIKNELEYNRKDDKVYGFEDFGEFGRVKSFANHALLLMLRGLNKSWKQIIGYYCGNVKGVTLAEIISSTITTLIQQGINVVAVVCDQGAANRTAYNRLGVTIEKPFFKIMNCTIFCFYDVVHLLKSVRNNLLVSNIIIDDKTVSWSILNKMFYAENGVIRSMHKLTVAHIKPDNFQKMKVKLATEVFSHHVSTAIFASASTNMFNEQEKLTAFSTADFIFKLNKLFDNMNSTNRYSKNPDKCALAIEQPDIISNLKNSLEWIAKWKREKKGAIYCFSGLCQTINATLQLWDAVEQPFLITSHLNSDCLENTISVVRNNRGSYEKNPSVFRLHINLKQMCFYNIIAPDTTSYETSDCSVILNMEDVENFLNPEGIDYSFIDESLNPDDLIPNSLIPVLPGAVHIKDNSGSTSDAEDDEVPNECEFDDSDSEDTMTNNNNESGIREPTINDMATTYFAGYIAFAVLKNHNCKECKIFMCKPHHNHICI